MRRNDDGNVCDDRTRRDATTVSDRTHNGRMQRRPESARSEKHPLRSC
jgi:hypothetical protein